MTLITRLVRLALFASVLLLGACKPANEAPHASVAQRLRNAAAVSVMALG